MQNHSPCAQPVFVTERTLRIRSVSVPTQSARFPGWLNGSVFFNKRSCFVQVTRGVSRMQSPGQMSLSSWCKCAINIKDTLLCYLDVHGWPFSERRTGYNIKMPALKEAKAMIKSHYPLCNHAVSRRISALAAWLLRKPSGQVLSETSQHTDVEVTLTMAGGGAVLSTS